MGLRIVQVDAFASRPFTGNPAAVCVLPEPKGDRWMQAVALEMNLAETAFLHRRPDGEYHLRWFTPATEVALCGHATLASAHVLWEEGHLSAGRQARFHTLSGLLTADRDGGWIFLDFPATVAEPCAPPDGLIEALGSPPCWTGKSRFDYLVELDSEATIRELRPDLGSLRALPVRGIIVTARGADHDFVSRFFAPAVGIDEDPVTGSAHCCLGPYWAAKLGRTTLLAYQASARGGLVRVRVDGERVNLGGQAVTVLRGEFDPAAA
ncbi:MAG: PhzF family phenazine biosynthesis protein [Bryobacteraceae bacterium]